MIPVNTPKGEFNVWTRKVGDNPSVKLLTLHGGPGATHEYFECFEDYLPQAGFEFYYYDQLGSHAGDQPDEPALWEIPRFVDEVEQVRRALRLDAGNFVLLGQSWGGLLAMEYALHHGEHLKALVISNMMSSIPSYNAYARDALMPSMDPDALAEIQRLEAEGTTEDPRYMELLVEHHYVLHLCRLPAKEWPDPVSRGLGHTNPAVYVPMQGPSELGASGKLETWDRSADLQLIDVPTLVIGASHDTMDPEHMLWMAGQLPRGRYLHCPDGSHLAQFDDPVHYFPGLLDFLTSLSS
jgi:proline iminopeptidase